MNAASADGGDEVGGMLAATRRLSGRAVEASKSKIKTRVAFRDRLDFIFIYGLNDAPRTVRRDGGRQPGQTLYTIACQAQ